MRLTDSLVPCTNENANGDDAVSLTGKSCQCSPGQTMCPYCRLKSVVNWLVEQGFTVLASSAECDREPVVQIAYSVSARRELRTFPAGSRTNDRGKTITRFMAKRNGIRIVWEREEGRLSYKKPR